MCNCKEKLKNQYAEKFVREGITAKTDFNYYSYGTMIIQPYIKRKWRTVGMNPLEKPKEGYSKKPIIERVKFNYCPICGEKL